MKSLTSNAGREATAFSSPIRKDARDKTYLDEKERMDIDKDFLLLTVWRHRPEQWILLDIIGIELLDLLPTLQCEPNPLLKNCPSLRNVHILRSWFQDLVRDVPDDRTKNSTRLTWAYNYMLKHVVSAWSELPELSCFVDFCLFFIAGIILVVFQLQWCCVVRIIWYEL